MVKAQPDISVAVICYNQEKFIEQTLNGVAIQNFTGTIEIVIGDDRSTDRTRELIRNFAEKRDDVRLLFHERNLGMVGNWTATVDACRGRYIALCEGDDYWTDPLKLQRQFDLMEEHPEHSQCWHPVGVVEEGVQRPHPFDDGVEVASLDDIIKKTFIHTCGLFFRNGLISEWPKWINNVMSMDLTLEYIIGMHGTTARVNHVMGVYRQHPGGITKTDRHMRLGQLRLVQMLRNFNEYSDHIADKTIRSRMADITRLQLKMTINRQFQSMGILVQFFLYHLYATNVNSFYSFRNEAYKHLIPKTYQKMKKLM